MQQAVAMKKEENILINNNAPFKNLNNDSEEYHSFIIKEQTKNKQNQQREKLLSPWQVPTEEEIPKMRGIGPFILVETTNPVDDNLKSVIISRTARHISLIGTKNHFEVSVKGENKERFELFAKNKSIKIEDPQHCKKKIPNYRMISTLSNVLILI